MRFARLALGLICCALAAAGPASGAPAAQLPTKAPLGIAGEGGGLVALSRFDPVTLAPREPRTDIPEWHNGYSFSPDGERLALTVSMNPTHPTPGLGRVGVEIVDLITRAVTEVQTGIAAGALAWLTPHRVVGLLQGGTIVVVDPDQGKVLSRHGAPGGECTDPPGQDATARLLVMLLENRVVTADKQGRVRSAALSGFPRDCSVSGMALDRVRNRAYVAGVGTRVAEVNLSTMHVSYRTVPHSLYHGDPYTAALPLGGGRLVVAHQTNRALPRGVELLDPAKGTRRVVDAQAGVVRLAGSLLLAVDGRGAIQPGASEGLRAYGHDGKLRFRLLGNEAVQDVQVLGRFAYARVEDGLRVIDLRARRVVSRSDYPSGLELHFLKR
jgi:hypothetical protein